MRNEMKNKKENEHPRFDFGLSAFKRMFSRGADKSNKIGELSDFEGKVNPKILAELQKTQTRVDQKANNSFKDGLLNATRKGSRSEIKNKDNKRNSITQQQQITIDG